MANINPRSAWAIFKFRLTGEKLNLSFSSAFSCSVGGHSPYSRDCTARPIAKLHDSLVNLFKMPFMSLLQAGTVSTFQLLDDGNVFEGSLSPRTGV